MSLESKFTAFRTKVGEKLQWLKDAIEDFDGIGLSEDPGNDLVLGSDQKLFYKRYTASEIGSLYEGLSDRNQFTNALKTTVQNNAAALPNKADLEDGFILSSQIPDFTFSNIVVPTETNISDFAAASGNYTFYAGWMVALQIPDGNGGTAIENWFYVGGDPADINSYSPVNIADVHWDNVAGKPNVETITGAQEKANLAEQNAKDYATPNGGNTTDTAQSLSDRIDAIQDITAPQLTSSDDSIKIQEEDITVNVDNFNLNTYFNNQINF